MPGWRHWEPRDGAAQDISQSFCLERRGADLRTESRLESLLEGILEKQGLRRPESQVEVRVRGALVARVDFAYPQVKVALEGDSRRWHSSPQEPREPGRNGGPGGGSA